jgi:hypothetical protein
VIRPLRARPDVPRAAPPRNRPAESDWKKSQASNSGDNCVEVASTDKTVFIRDSKVRNGFELCVSPEEWTLFVTSIKQGELSL